MNGRAYVAACVRSRRYRLDGSRIGELGGDLDPLAAPLPFLSPSASQLFSDGRCPRARNELSKSVARSGTERSHILANPPRRLVEVL